MAFMTSSMAFIACPANANSNQRFLTLESFRRAGFRVLGMINEPSAAGIEYAERFAGRGLTGKRVFLVVYAEGSVVHDHAENPVAMFQKPKHVDRLDMFKRGIGENTMPQIKDMSWSSFSLTEDTLYLFLY
jgi:hypothetical protein